MNRIKFKFTGFIVLSLILIVSMAACDNGELGDTTPDTYNVEVIIEGVVNEEHAEVFSISSNRSPSIDEFNYEDNKLTGDITGLTGTIELTLVINNDSLTDEEYTVDNKVIEVDSDNNEAKFEVKYIEKLPEIAEIDVNNDVNDISVETGTTKEDALDKLVNEIVITDTEDNNYTVKLDWTIEDYNSEVAKEYSATGTFELPVEVKQTDPATDLIVEATVTVLDEPTYTVSVNSDNGTVEGYGDYSEGEEIELIATPAEGYEFIEWTGYVESTVNPLTFDMPAEDVELNAVFREGTSDFAGGKGTETNPYQVATAEQLDKVRNYLDSHFKQINNIDLKIFNENDGWKPIGNIDNGFTGVYNGNGYVISNLFINKNNDNTGLFGYLGDQMSGTDSIIKNLTLEQINLNSQNNVGGLVGINSKYGTISNVVVRGTISGNENVGGIAGKNEGGILSEGSILDSNANVKINGVINIGGLVGTNIGYVFNSYTQGSVEGNEKVGGLIGRNRRYSTNENNSGLIEDSYSESNVLGNKFIGGLVGYSHEDYLEVSYISGELINSYSDGNVTGKEEIGGIIGRNSGVIKDSYVKGYIKGDLWVGGLIGVNTEDGELINSYVEGEEINGDINAGGLVGYNYGEIKKSYNLKNIQGVEVIGGLAGINEGGSIVDSYSIANIDGDTWIGGITGINHKGGKINTSYSKGLIEGTKGIGGLTGSNLSEIENSYSHSDLNGKEVVGGLVGSNESGNILNSYAIGKIIGDIEIGGIAGINIGGTIINSYYDQETTGLNDQGKGQPKSTEEMIQQNTFEPEWDFDTIWDIDEGSSYPYFQWQDENILVPSDN